jgi:hypothetical protein
MTAAKRAALAPRPALPAPTAGARLKRLNVDLAEGDHRNLKIWAAGEDLDASALVRALLVLAIQSPDTRRQAEAIARRLIAERREARR